MAIDTKDTKDSLFGNLKKTEKKIQEPVKEPPAIEHTQEVSEPEVPKKTKPEHSTAKFHTFDKVTALLTTEQKEGLDRIARRMMKQRGVAQRGAERITANTIMRAVIGNFLEVEGNFKHDVMSSEEDVYEWAERIFNRES